MHIDEHEHQNTPHKVGPVLTLSTPHFSRTITLLPTNPASGAVAYYCGSASSTVLNDMIAVAKARLTEDETALATSPIGDLVHPNGEGDWVSSQEPLAHYIARHMVGHGEYPPGALASRYLATTPIAGWKDDAELQLQAACALAVQHRHGVVTQHAHADVAAAETPGGQPMVTKRGRDLASKLNPFIGTTAEIERLSTVLAADAAAYNRIQERLCSDDLGEAGQADAENRADHLENRMTDTLASMPLPDDGRWGIHFSGDPRGHTVRIIPPGATTTDRYIGVDVG